MSHRAVSDGRTWWRNARSAKAIAGQTGASQPELSPFKVRPNSKHFFFRHSPAPAARPEAGDHFGGGAVVGRRRGGDAQGE